MKKYVKIILAVLFPLYSLAQPSTPKTFLITTDTVPELELNTTYWRVWDDSTTNTNFNVVSNPNFNNRFRQFDTTQKFDFSVKTFWYKLKLKNTLNKPIEIGLRTYQMHADIYYSDSSHQWQHLKTGSAYNKSLKDGYKLLNIVTPTILPEQEIEIYLRENSFSRHSIPKNRYVLLMQNALQKTFHIKDKLSDLSAFENFINAFL